MRTTLAIAQGFYVSDALPISAQRCVNFYPSLPQTSTITDANLFNTPGIDGLITGSSIESCRGAHVMASIAYFVIDNTLTRLNRTVVSGVATFTTTALGTIPGNQRVYMADNGIQLCIVAIPDLATTGKSYIFTADPDTLTEITDVNFDGPASSVEYVAGYFMFHKSDGKKFFNSPLNNGLTGYDPLDFNVAEADPDQIRGLGVLNNELYVFGSETIQRFRNIGRAPSPFAPVTGSTIDIGVAAPQTIVKFGGGLAFVGGGVNESPAVWIISGGQKKKISTNAIENEFSRLRINAIPEQVFSWVYAESGAYWMGISVPGTCYVYDLVNERWHERQSVDESTLDRYRASHMLNAYGRILVGDTQTGNIGALDEDVYTEFDILTPRLVTSRPFDNQGDAVNVASIEAVVESGVGLANDITLQTGTTELGQPIMGTGGSDPKLVLSWSDGGGRTFDGFMPRSMGKLGEYSVRPTWSRLGVFDRQRVIQFSISSPTKATIIKVEADIG
jgi:hypothetical protein